jgi:hypothetical protein
MPYKFKVGETVTVRQTRNSNVPGCAFEGQLPGTQGQPEYQIKSMDEPHQRVAKGNELSKA